MRLCPRLAALDSTRKGAACSSNSPTSSLFVAPDMLSTAKGFGGGKVILVGEHAVVHGVPAIADALGAESFIEEVSRAA